MSPFNWYVILSLSGITLINTLLAIKFRSFITKMAGMMIAMYVGMNIGITTGLVFGSIYQGNLFFSTLVSLLSGLLVGISFGITMGILPGIEALMAGVMGGMMGAMLGEMISMSESDVLIKIFLTLTITSFLLFFILSTGQTSQSQVSKKGWFLKPIGLVLVTAIYLLFGSHLNSSGKNFSNQEGHMHHTPPIEQTSKQLTLAVATNSFNYNPSELKVRENEKVLLSLTNSDNIEHDFQIKSIPISHDSDNNQHPSHQTHADIHLHVAANSTGQLTFTPLAKGVYEFYCSIPGHKENGMIGKLIVY